MSGAKLTTNELCEISGLDRYVLEKWARGGFLTPANNVAGSGHYRTWSVVSATAATYAAAAGAVTGSQTEGYAALLARFVARHSPEELEFAFAEGRTFAVPVGGDEVFALVVPPEGVALPPHCDLEATYRHVLYRIEGLITAKERQQERPRETVKV